MSMGNSSNASFVPTLVTNSLAMDDHVCRLILYYEIPNTKIRFWDLVILIPNLVFLSFLILRFNRAILKLRATNSPIFLTFYALVVINIIVSVLRCLISMLVDLASNAGGYVDIIMWLIVRFFLLATEISVIVFGLAFGHLDSRSSIRYVLSVTSFFSLAYSISQGTLEVMVHDEMFHVHSQGIVLFGHGGVTFWFISSVIFTLLYLTILVLPLTKLRERFPLPEKKSFYMYIMLLMFLNISCSIGGAMLLYNIKEGLCIVDITTCVYFTFFTPLVYFTFLRDFFGVTQPSIMFSYKNQADDTIDEDSISIPHHQSFSSLKTDTEFLYHGPVYSGAHFVPTNALPVSSLYAASLQSPDSITGYSLDSQPIDISSGGEKL